MGIDRIGPQGPPVPPPSPETHGSGRVGRTDTPFELAFEPAPPDVATTAPPQGAAVQAAPVDLTRTALQKLQTGEIDLNGYLDLKAHEATAHLAALPPSELAALRSAMRDRMASDPTLVELVRTATGRVPDPPPEE
jgi:hypothetical protein